MNERMNKQWEVTHVQYSPLFTCIIIVHLAIAPQGRCFYYPHFTRARKVSEFLRSQSLDRVELEPTEVLFSTTVPTHGGMRKDPGPTDFNDQNLRHHSAPRRPTPAHCAASQPSARSPLSSVSTLLTLQGPTVKCHLLREALLDPNSWALGF